MALGRRGRRRDGSGGEEPRREVLEGMPARRGGVGKGETGFPEEVELE